MTLARDLQLAVPTGGLEAYSNKIASFSVLSAEQEIALALRFRQEEDLDAARQLVLSHLRFVAHIARSYAGYGLSQADLIQEGNVGLMKAVKRFDPDKGVRLVSFAVHWIRAEIHEFVLKNWRIVKVATTKAQRKLFFNLRSQKKGLSWFSQEEIENVAKDLGVKPKEVVEMESRLNGHDASFDPPEDDSNDQQFSPAAYLTDMRDDPNLVLERQDWDQHHTENLYAALDGLDERSKNILQKRWLTDDKVTLQSLAKEYGVSAERVRQLEQHAIKKLQAVMT